MGAAGGIVVVTGASGFVGRRVCAELARQGYAVRACVRSSDRRPDLAADIRGVGDISGVADWRDVLHGAAAVVHLAARVHVMRETAADPLREFRRINVDATRALAAAAASCGVRRLVYVSSIKVNGERTFQAPFTSDDPPAPRDPYGVSKWEAEQVLASISAQTGLETCVVRPPLVYGPGVRGNFVRLLGLVKRGVPLPFGAVDNRRSMVYVDNLASALAACASHPAAAGRTYLVSDDEDVSTRELVERIARAMHRNARNLLVPPVLLGLAGRVLRREEELERLTGSLAVCSRPIREELGWSAPWAMEQGLTETVAWYNRRP